MMQRFETSILKLGLKLLVFFELFTSLLEFLVFQTKNFGGKNQIWTRAKKTLCHFE
jgi:hypothetical protein